MNPEGAAGMGADEADDSDNTGGSDKDEGIPQGLEEGGDLSRVYADDRAAGEEARAGVAQDDAGAGIAQENLGVADCTDDRAAGEDAGASVAQDEAGVGIALDNPGAGVAQDNLGSIAAD